MTNADRDALVARLDAFIEFQGTIPIFDALSSPDGPEQLDAVAKAIGLHPTHPLARDVRQWLKDNGVAVYEPTTEDLLRELGIDDLRTWYERRARERQVLERSLADAQEERASALLSANAYSFMCVLLFFVALLGWGAAFGFWTFTPEAKVPGPHDPTPVAPAGP